MPSEPQVIENKNRCFEEAATYLLDINVASINELVFKQKVVEPMLKIKSLKASGCVHSKIPLGEISTSNVQREDLMKQADVFVKENKELGADFPLLLSLDDDIGSLEEHTVSLANDNVLNNEKEQGNNLSATLEQKRFEYAISLLRKKLSSGMRSDKVIMMGIASTCRPLGALDLAK